MSEKRFRPKMSRIRDLKECSVVICARKHNVDPVTLSSIGAWFKVECTFKIDPNIKYSNFSLIKIVRDYKFSWMEQYACKTIIFLTDKKMTYELKPTSTIPNGVDTFMSKPSRISEKECKELLSQGAYIATLSGDDELSAVGVATFKNKPQ